MLSADVQLRHIEQEFLATGSIPLSDGQITIDPWDVTGTLELDIQYPTGHRLAIPLTIDVSFGYPIWTQYSFHLQGPIGQLVFRYDNAPHHPDLPSFPHHKHLRPAVDRERVIAHPQPSLGAVLREIWEPIGQAAIQQLHGQQVIELGQPPVMPSEEQSEG